MVKPKGLYRRSRERAGTKVLKRRFTHDANSVRGPRMGQAAIRADLLWRLPSFKRVVTIAAAMATAPNQSLPERHENWADLKAAYRFLNNPKVTPEGIQQTHRAQVRAACVEHARILAVEDGSELDYTAHRSVQGLGFVGGGIGRGLLQHSTLAVTTDGRLLGVLHQIWWKRQRTAEGETRRQRQSRRTESGLWSESIAAVGSLGPTTRVIHVADRGGDCFETMQSACEQGAGFLIRAKHNRFVGKGSERLWALLQRQPVAGLRQVAVAARPAKGKQPAQPARQASLAVRFASVVIPPPRNDPRFTKPLSAWAVYVCEVDAPAGVDAIEWMLLTSEPVEDVDQANECVDWYTYRWLIEEWHKVEKTGCRLEASQLKSAEALERLAALTAVVAVRLIQLRALAQAEANPADPQSPARPKEQSLAWQGAVPRDWILVVSHLAGCRPETLTARLFWLTIAKRGGFLGRKNDGPPGWQTIWKGWSKVMMLVEGIQLHRAMQTEQTCG